MNSENTANRSDIIKAVLAFTLLVICVGVTVWMIYNYYTTGSFIPPVLSSVSSDVIKDVKL